MVNQFIDQVISKGADAALPQNLNEEWLDKIYIAAKNFLKTAAGNTPDQSDAEFLGDDNSLIMLSAVTDIAQHQKGYSPEEKTFELPEEELFEYISCYSLSIIIESIVRETEIEVEQPTIETIFDRERLFEVELKIPDITKLLNQLILEDDLKSEL